MKIITKIGKVTRMVNVQSLNEHHVNKIYRECDVNLFIERLAVVLYKEKNTAQLRTLSESIRKKRFIDICQSKRH